MEERSRIESGRIKLKYGKKKQKKKMEGRIISCNKGREETKKEEWRREVE